MSWKCVQCEKDFKRGFIVKEGGFYIEICPKCKIHYPKKNIQGEFETAKDFLGLTSGLRNPFHG